MAYIFGSGVGDLAQMRQSTDAQNINLAERDAQLRQAAAEEYNRQAQAAQENAQRQAFQFASASQANQQRNQDLARSDFQFGLARSDQAKADAESRRRFDVQTGLQQQQIKATTGTNDYNELLSAIQTGGIKTPDDIDKLFAHVGEDQRTRAKAYLQAYQEGKLEDWNTVNASAKAATGLIQAGNVDMPAKPGPIYKFGFGGTAAVPKKTFTEEEALAKLAGNKTFAKVLPQLSFDEATQQFVPVMPKPAFSFSATNQPSALPNQPTPSVSPVLPPPSTGTNFSFGPRTPQAAPTVAPVVMPSAAATNAPWQMPQPRGVTPAPSTNQAPFAFNGAPPVTNSAPRMAMGGYRLGAIYRGTMKYLGGDPTDPASWQQLQ